MNINSLTFIFISLIIHVISLIPNSTFIGEEDEYFINDMSEEEFIENNTEPYKNFFNLEEGNNNSYCELCKSGSDIFLNTIIQEYKWRYLHNFCTFVCSLALRKDICHSAIGRFGPILLENTFKRLLNKEKICTSLFICKPTVEYESIEEYAKRILKKKNTNTKKIETNNNFNLNNFSFIQITDSHLQLDYQENKVINCNIPLCCRNTPEELGFKNNKNHKGEELKFSKKYGAAGKCDANIEIIRAFAKEAKKLKNNSKIDFILFTGDFSAHNVWEVSQEEIVEVTQISVDEIEKEIGYDIPIYPAIGNHEKAPPDVYFGSETILLHGLSNVFEKYLTQEAYDTFSQFGYYTMMHKNTNLRIVSLNCIICDSFNFNLIGDSFQVAKMFKWLENILSEAEKNNERVYILDHIPLRSSQHSSDCTFRLKILIERYQNIISGLISAHTHRDEINLIKEYSNPKKYSIINYIGPGLSTYNKFWPSYRIYYADNETKIINDFVQMRLNLDETNKNDKPIWFVVYKASEYYNVTTMNDFDNIAKANIDETYVKHFLTDNPGNEKEYKNPKVINKVKCFFQNDNYKDIARCKNIDKGGEFYLHYVLNILFAYWPKL